MGSFGITDLYVETQSKSLVIMPIAGVCSQCCDEYQALVDDVNDALQLVGSKESTFLLGDLNAHIGTDNKT